MSRRRWREGALIWNFVTGEVEPGESPEQAVVREVREEVGLDVTAQRRLGERVHPASSRFMIYFACDIAAGEPHLVDHEENIEVRWSTLEEAAELLTPTGGVWQPIRQYLEQAVAASERR
jgi:8-oxo-dGTP diphosphatase